MRRSMIVAAAVLALAGCKRGQKMQAVGTQPPERTLEATTFPHSMHGGFDCNSCHEGIEKWTKLGEYRVPPASKCGECHDADAMHTPPTRAARTDYAFRFSHADHLARLKDKKDACASCHQVLPEPGERRKVTPPMSACTSCHAHQVEVMEARCTPCHVSLKAYGAKPIEQFVELSHGGNFVKEHGRLAKNTAESCAQCHDQTYCATCHATATAPVRAELKFPENVTSDFIHRGDYVSRHRFDAERDPASCKKCHGTQLCDSCHQAQNLSPRSLNPRNPHPGGWVQRGSGAFHGDAARTNIVSCSGCHDQGAASNCVACHQSRGPGLSGVGGNPHPGGWKSRHDRGDIPKNVACRACHVNG